MVRGAKTELKENFSKEKRSFEKKKNEKNRMILRQIFINMKNSHLVLVKLSIGSIHYFHKKSTLPGLFLGPRICWIFILYSNKKERK